MTARLTAQGALEIDVADNGPGIPPEIRNQIFMPFFSTKGTKGTGLGLATSVKVAREHGGDITLAHSEEGAAAIDIDHLGFALDRRQRRQFGRGQRERGGDGEGDQGSRLRAGRRARPLAPNVLALRRNQDNSR